MNRDRGFMVALPSNAGGAEFPNNTTSSFKTRLPKPLEFGGDKWEVGLASISLPDAPVQFIKLFNKDPSIALLIDAWITRNKAAPTTYKVTAIRVFASEVSSLSSITDGESLMWAILSEAGRLKVKATKDGNYVTAHSDTSKLTNSEYRFEKHAGDVDLVIDHSRTLVSQKAFGSQRIFIDGTLAQQMGWVVKNGSTYTLGPNCVPEIYNNQYCLTRDESGTFNSFDPPAIAGVNWIYIQDRLALSKNVSWRLTNLNQAYQKVVGRRSRTLHVYTDAAASSMVGQGIFDLLREVEYTNEGGGTRYFEPRHVQYYPIRVNRMETIEVEVSETSGQLVKFTPGTTPTILTLEFRPVQS